MGFAQVDIFGNIPTKPTTHKKSPKDDLVKSDYFTFRDALRERIAHITEPDEIYEEFVKTAEGLTYTQILDLRTTYQNVATREISQLYWDASVRYCREFMEVERYIREYKTFKSKIRLSKDKLVELVSRLALMDDEKEIRAFLGQQDDGDDWTFYPGDYSCMFLAKTSDPTQIKEILIRTGRMSKPVKPQTTS